MFTSERDRGGTEEEEEDIEDTRMGVGKNTTSKSMDSSSEGGKFEEESKHGADFYPIPVHKHVECPGYIYIYIYKYTSQCFITSVFLILCSKVHDVSVTKPQTHHELWLTRSDLALLFAWNVFV